MSGPPRTITSAIGSNGTTRSGTSSSSSSNRDVFSVLVLCLLWYAVSSSNNVIGKMVLSEFPYPMTMTMVQLLSITVYSGPLFNMLGVRRYVDISWHYYFRLIVPLAFGKFFASVFSHVSIWKVPVSYAHTVKATMPLFTVILARIIMKEKQTMKVYLSLIPIITGVAIATVTEISFDMIGLVSALCATMGFSLQHIFSKKVLHDTGVHHLRLLHILGRLALFMFLPVWLIVDIYNLYHHASETLSDSRIVFLLFIDGVLNFLQNIIAFSVLSFVTPLTYAVANASKRIFVIAVSLFILGNPVTYTNIFGMLLAIFGVLYYNKAKYDAKQQQQRETILPYSQKSWHDRNYAIYNNGYNHQNGYTPLANGNGVAVNLPPHNNNYSNGLLDAANGNRFQHAETKSGVLYL